MKNIPGTSATGGTPSSPCPAAAAVIQDDSTRARDGRRPVGAVVLQFPRSQTQPETSSAGMPATPATLRGQLEVAAARLAVESDELGQRISSDLGKTVTMNMTNGYRERIKRLREQLDAMDGRVDDLVPLARLQSAPALRR